MLALGTAFSTSFATNNASDYVSVTGIKFVDAGTGAAGTAPSTAGLVRHTQRHILFGAILPRNSAARSRRTMRALRSGWFSPVPSCRKRPC